MKKQQNAERRGRKEESYKKNKDRVRELDREGKGEND